MIFDSIEKEKALTRIVAHLMGDGCVSKRYFGYYNKELSLLEHFKKDLAFLFPDTHFISGKCNSGTSFYTIQNKKIHTFLLSLLQDFRSHNLVLPEFINTKELQVEFLRALFDDEGTVGVYVYQKTNEIKRKIAISSTSLKLLNQIKGILEIHFDIKSNKIIRCIKITDSKKFIYYILAITGRENFIKFRNQINFKHPIKRKKLDLMINAYIRKYE